MECRAQGGMEDRTEEGILDVIEDRMENRLVYWMEDEM